MFRPWLLSRRTFSMRTTTTTAVRGVWQAKGFSHLNHVRLLTFFNTTTSRIHQLLDMSFDLRCFTSKSCPLLAASSSSPFDPEKVKTRTSSFATGQQQQQTTTQPTRRKRKEFIPRKAAVELTERARLFFKKLLTNPPRSEIIGILLNYDQSTTGEPRMVFSFSFITALDLERLILAHNGTAPPEGISLEVVVQEEKTTPGAVTRGGTPEATTSRILVPKSPAASKNDGLPKLYVSGNAFLKVLGATVDVDPNGDLTPILLDKQGNRMDPNA